MIHIRIASFINEIATIDYYNVGRGYLCVKFTLWDVGEHYVRSRWNNNSPTHKLTNSPWNFTLVPFCNTVLTHSLPLCVSVIVLNFHILLPHWNYRLIHGKNACEFFVTFWSTVCLLLSIVYRSRQNIYTKLYMAVFL